MGKRSSLEAQQQPMALQLTATFLLVTGFYIIATPALGNMQCEKLPVDLCAFAVDSSGARCVLESRVLTDRSFQYECQSSTVMAKQFVEWIETEDCINACGVERMLTGLSTDSLVESDLTQMLCSAECKDNCPNIFDLYTKLAAGEGVHLPHVCNAQKVRSRKLITGSDFFWASKSINNVDAWISPSPAFSPVNAPAL